MPQVPLKSLWSGIWPQQDCHDSTLGGLSLVCETNKPYVRLGPRACLGASSATPVGRLFARRSFFGGGSLVEYMGSCSCFHGRVINRLPKPNKPKFTKNIKITKKNKITKTKKKQTQLRLPKPKNQKLGSAIFVFCFSHVCTTSASFAELNLLQFLPSEDMANVDPENDVATETVAKVLWLYHGLSGV